MPRGALGGSRLAELAAQRRKIIQARNEILPLSERGITKPQRGPPPQAPAAGQKQAPASEFKIPDEVRQRMLEQVGPVLEGMRQGGAAPPPQAGGIAPMAEIPAPPLLADRLRQVRADVGVSPEIAFYRLAGRSPSPRRRRRP